MASDTRVPGSDLFNGDGEIDASTGTDRYAMVDEAIGSHDSAGTYIFNSDASFAQIMAFGFTSPFAIPSGSTINYVRLELVAIPGSAFQEITAGLWMEDAAAGANQFFPGDVIYQLLALPDYTTNPLTESAWTVDQVNGVGANALQGCYVRLQPDPACRVTAMLVAVDYTTGGRISKNTRSFPLGIANGMGFRMNLC
jgi:hypothetical protein